MAEKALPCPTLLRQLLRYEPETGKLFWRSRGVELFNSQRACNAWNARHSGREAFISEHPQGYARGQINRVSMPAHRVIWAICNGVWPNTVDHIDGDVKNNKIENLRDVTQAENNRNAKLRSDNKSGEQGVHWNKDRQKWVAVVGNQYLGLFSTKALAVTARRSAASEFGFHENHGR